MLMPLNRRAGIQPVAPVASGAHFPPHFVWGVATRDFQIEGAATEDDKGESIWDRICRVPGAIADHGDTACDPDHRLDEDLDLIAALGVEAYRFSVSWPRVQPLGQGACNEVGLVISFERQLDSFERASGCEKRFGIVFVDHTTERRIPKDRARRYPGFLQRQRCGALPAVDAARRSAA